MERRLISNSVYNRLPELLKELTINFEGREKDIVLLSSLAVLSNTFPNIKGIYDGDDIYPQLFVVIIAPAASGKGVMNYSRILIEKIHDKIFRESLQAYHECESQKKKDRTETCPNVQVKILPANISTSEMYSFLGSSEHGLIIIESEADTLSNMLKFDWSNYSDVLRKVFQHEPISISRKIDKVFEDIKEPKLAMLISGTPDQLMPLIKSRENGLFSRLIVYNFDEISPFKDVFEKSIKNNKIAFKNAGEKIFDLYAELVELEDKIEFIFTDNQEKRFVKDLSTIRTDIIENHSQGFVSNLHRHGLILYRIAMILTIVRNIDEIHLMKSITCSNTDYLLAYDITKTLLSHSQYTYNTIENGILSLQDEEILESLPPTFARQKFLEVGEQLGIPARTMDDKISQFKKKKLIIKVNRYTFRKI
jgi:hypothetical protein